MVGNHQDVGFFLHPTLVANAETGCPLGLSTIQLWHCERERPDKHQCRYLQLPIEEQESYQWLLAAERSQPGLLAGGVNDVGDRASDI